MPRNLPLTSLIRQKQGVIEFFVVFSKVFVMWLSLKMLRSRVLASFAGHCGLPCSLVSFRWTNEIAMASKGMYGSHRSNKATGSSLIVAHWQVSYSTHCALKLQTQHWYGICDTVACYAIACILVVTPFTVAWL